MANQQYNNDQNDIKRAVTAQPQYAQGQGNPQGYPQNQISSQQPQQQTQQENSEENFAPPRSLEVPTGAYSSATNQFQNQSYSQSPQQDPLPPPVPIESQSYQQPQSDQSYYDYPSYDAPVYDYGGYTSGVSSDTMTEIAEQAVTEKIAPIKNQLEKVMDLKNTLTTQVDNLYQRIQRLESTLDQLQLSILQKVGSYVQNVEDIKTELQETQKSFKAISRRQAKK